MRGHGTRTPYVILWVCSAITSLFLGASAAQAVDVVVVCPEEFREALRPWLAHRAEQGHDVAFVSNLGSPEAIRRSIRDLAEREPVRFVVLIGDAEPRLTANGFQREEITPVHRTEAKVNVQFGSEPHIAADNYYADLDDDDVPDLAVGRLTADSPAELSRMVQKILHYERQSDFGAWRQRIHFVGGLGGFGPLIDTALEQWAKRLITEGVPAGYSTTMTYGSWQSPYCPLPSKFCEATRARLNEGGLFWIYMGHGEVRQVDRLRVPGRQFPILSADDVPQLNNQRSPPIALFLSCYSGAFDARQDCLAEELLRADGGPVAVVCGSRVTMPYAMAVFGHELLQECFQKHRETLGELLLHAKRNTILQPRDDDFSRGLDAAAAAMNPQAGDLAEERAEHLALFNLLGDPLLRIAHPREVTVNALTQVTAGDRLDVTGRCDVDGRCMVELVVRRDRLTFKPPAREQYREQPGDAAAYDEVYRRANDQCLASKRTTVVAGAWSETLEVPADAHGPCHVRVYVEGADDFALGHADVKVLRLPRTAKKPLVNRSATGGGE